MYSATRSAEVWERGSTRRMKGSLWPTESSLSTLIRCGSITPKPEARAGYLCVWVFILPRVCAHASVCVCVPACVWAGWEAPSSLWEPNTLVIGAVEASEISHPDHLLMTHK